jgi:hypothetical protein
LIALHLADHRTATSRINRSVLGFRFPILGTRRGAERERAVDSQSAQRFQIISYSHRIWVIIAQRSREDGQRLHVWEGSVDQYRER